MKILMLEDRKATDDGFAVRQFEKGKIYDTASERKTENYISSHVAYNFISQGRAEQLNDKKMSPSAMELFGFLHEANHILYGNK